MDNIDTKVNKLISSVETQNLIDRALVDWRPILAKDCSCYCCGEQYLCKRFDQINYQFCNIETAKEILIDNLYVLLRYKYLTKRTDDVEKRIQDIVKSMTVNLRSSLIKISFSDQDTDCKTVSFLEDGQIAFRNGVYDFRTGEWILKYAISSIKDLSNTIYEYDSSKIITWYVNINFEPLPITVGETSLEDFISLMIELNKTQRNRCFELVYNMSHDAINRYDYKRFKHICEVMGYSLANKFIQSFVMLIGSGQNGKNSLFDGCVTERIIPRPVSLSMEDIETDRFMTGTLLNHSLNIFLESSAKTYVESQCIKQLTGSMLQTIQEKGVNRYASLINCKYIFSGNDQEKIKFADTTTGFRRRINVLEVYYHWDKDGRYLTKGDYYDSSFSEDLHEIKDDLANTTLYIYLAMFGIKSATENFTKTFKFTENDWRLSYSDVDFELKDVLENLDLDKITKYIKSGTKKYEDCKFLFYDTLQTKSKLYESPTMRSLGYYNYDHMITMLQDEEAYTSYFSENDVYMSVRLLQSICGDVGSAIAFTQSFKKLYSLTSLPSLYNNKPYVKVTFVNGKLKVIGE